MRERAQTLGGQLVVWSREGAGTEVDLTIPNSIAYSVRSEFGLHRKKKENREQLA
jgi:signal transduction histidine kinase